ncbi:MAG: transcriptional regulator [Deltaproteobacteria bacterium SG8_13]|nr:MAG: transcriptional regulator [Deltaproteobacteria bacterium SG8_13]
MKTLRQQMMALLAGAELSAAELASALRIKEKEVCEHLAHVSRSLSAAGKKLKIRPGSCRKCGYVFADRRRFTRPSRCPRCKSTYLEEPLFQISSD